MPALPSAPKVIQLQFVQNDDADLNVLNTLHYQYGGTASQADLNTFAETAENGWEVNMLPQQSPGMHLSSVVATDLTTTSSPRSTVVSGSPGTSTSPSVPAGTAMVISLHTARRFRGGHSRIYFAGLPATATTNAQTWNPVVTANVLAAFSALDIAIRGYGGATMGTVALCAVSYFQGFTVVTNPVSHRARNVPTLRGAPLIEAVTSFSINPKVASQRRRNLQSR